MSNIVFTEGLSHHHEHLYREIPLNFPSEISVRPR